jgi:hypothetical protein
MAPLPIQFPGEAIRVSRTPEIVAFRDELQATSRAPSPPPIWQPGPFKPFFEIGLFWIAALACLVAFSIWAL